MQITFKITNRHIVSYLNHKGIPYQISGNFFVLNVGKYFKEKQKLQHRKPLYCFGDNIL